MSGERSAWRANDVVAYDAMREAANTLIALLMRQAEGSAVEFNHAVSDATKIRRQLLEVDGYDRAAVDAARRRLNDRIDELAGKRS